MTRLQLARYDPETRRRVSEIIETTIDEDGNLAEPVTLEPGLYMLARDDAPLWLQPLPIERRATFTNMVLPPLAALTRT